MKKVVMVVALLGISGLQAECYCKRNAAKQEQKKQDKRTNNPVKAVGRVTRDVTVRGMKTTAKVVEGTGKVVKKATCGFFDMIGTGLDKLFPKKQAQ